MDKMNQTTQEVKEAVLESLKWELEQINKGESKEIYFHDTIHQDLDNIISANDRSTNMQAIDEIGGEDQIDEGMIDRNADLTMQIAQIAYCVVEQDLFNDDFMQELQSALNNETIDYKTARQLIKKIDKEII